MKQNNITIKLPNIPNKRYFTIGEVAHLCSVKPHVLRYWEQEFPQLRPAKRRGNRRYYQRTDVVMVRNIRGLLYDEGYTISGARIQLDQVVKQQKQADKAVQIPEITYSYSFAVEADDSHETAAATQAKNQQDPLDLDVNSDFEENEKIKFVTEPEVDVPLLPSAAAAKTIPSMQQHASFLKDNSGMHNQEHRCKYKSSIKEAIVELKSILSELNHA